MDERITTGSGRARSRLLAGVSAATIRHFPGDTSAQAAAQAAGLVWPDSPGALTGDDPWMAWRSPQEVLLIGLRSAPLQTLLQSLAPGRCATALALDLSEALAVFELHGPMIDDWLSHLVDALAIPRQIGRVTRCRLADVPVLLMRLDPERVWLVADRPTAPYLGNWLAYAHEGAFAATR
jgi:sarcosine oxidase gamma subunit